MPAPSARRAAARFEPQRSSRRVAGEQVEAVVAARRRRRARGSDAERRRARGEQRASPARRATARAGSCRDGSRTLVTSAQRPRRSTPSQVPPRLEVAAGEEALVPPVRGRGGARVELVAVGGDDQPVARMRVERDQREAHGAGRGQRTLGVRRARRSGGSAAKCSTCRLPSGVERAPRRASARSVVERRAGTPRHRATGLVDLHPRRSGSSLRAQQRVRRRRCAPRRRPSARPMRRARRGRVRGDPVIDVEVRWRCARASTATSGLSASRSRGARFGGGNGVGQRQRGERAGRRAHRSRASPRSAAASCSTARRSLPPPGAGAALTTVPQGWSPNAALKSRSPGRGVRRVDVEQRTSAP